MSRRSSRKRAGPRPSKDDKREAARQRKRELSDKANAHPLQVGSLNLAETSDTRLLERAIRQKWNIPQEFLDAAPKAMLEIVNNKRGLRSDRNRIAATRAGATLHGQNLAIEKGTQAEQPIIVNVATAVQVNVSQAITEATDEQLDAFLDAAGNQTRESETCGPETQGIVASQNGIHSPLAKPSTNGVSGKH